MKVKVFGIDMVQVRFFPVECFEKRLFTVTRFRPGPFPVVVPKVLRVKVVGPGSKNAHRRKRIDISCDRRSLIRLNGCKNLRHNPAGFYLISVNRVIIIFIERSEVALCHKDEGETAKNDCKQFFIHEGEISELQIRNLS